MFICRVAPSLASFGGVAPAALPNHYFHITWKRVGLGVFVSGLLPRVKWNLMVYTLNDVNAQRGPLLHC